ncbi:MAG: glycine cleavage system protein GcvH [Candidatus Omnitrophica bacterium]|nr:glycine cleavage system protein GcvH [Candidatus Omnitrophota bacterium]
MKFPNNCKYTKTHEWTKKEEKVCIVGVTEYAQKELSDVVYVELPDISRDIKAGEAVCVVESVKAAFDIFAPLSGRVLEVNTDLENNPALINSDPYGKGWLFKLECSNENELNSLMDAAAYGKHIEGEQ